MNVNMSSVDRWIRVAIAVAIVVVTPLAPEGRAIWPAVLLAVAVLLTALFGRCPTYAFYGLSTRGGLRRRSCDGACSPVPGRRPKSGAQVPPLPTDSR